MAHPWFRVGAKVEVLSSVPCLRIKFFPATMIAPSFDSNDKYLVEYETLVMEEEDGASTPFQEDVDVGLIRPRPPPDKRMGFKCNDTVDALFNGSWWEGVVTKVLHNSRYMVHFDCVHQSYQFQGSEMRIHRDWIKGTWVPAFKVEEEKEVKVKVKQEQVDLEVVEYRVKEGTKNKTSQKLFGRGTLVEVRNDEDGFRGAWYAATIVGMNNNNKKFLVEYLDLRSEMSEELLKEEVDVQQLRPYPLEKTVIDGRYKNHDKVDAFYNDGWWEGIICKVLDGCMYRVYFHGTEDELVIHQSELRPRHNWVGGKWVTCSSIARKPRQKIQKNNYKNIRRHSTAY